MLCTNFGLAGTASRTRTLLCRLAAMAEPQARLMAHSLDPSQATQPEHIAYIERNRARGRMPGQLRQRLRYRALRTDWFEQIYAAPDEIELLAAGTGWRLDQLLCEPNPDYVAILTRTR